MVGVIKSVRDEDDFVVVEHHDWAAGSGVKVKSQFCAEPNEGPLGATMTRRASASEIALVSAWNAFYVTAAQTQETSR